MKPTLVDGDLLITKAFDQTREVSHGDIVVATSAAEGTHLIVKRVVGLPGDVISYRDGYGYVNCATINDTCEPTNLFHISEEFVYDASSMQLEGGEEPSKNGIYQGIYVLGEDEYWLIGDNASVSKDSRYVGCFHKEQIREVVYMKVTFRILAIIALAIAGLFGASRLYNYLYK